jgi:hypothetical protein
MPHALCLPTPFCTHIYFLPPIFLPTAVGPTVAVGHRSEIKFEAKKFGAIKWEESCIIMKLSGGRQSAATGI